MTDPMQPKIDNNVSTASSASARLGRQAIRLLLWPLRMPLRLMAKTLNAIPLLSGAFAWAYSVRDGLQHHITAWQIAWSTAKREEPLTVPKGKELEFLPAVLEVQESPTIPRWPGGCADDYQRIRRRLVLGRLR